MDETLKRLDRLVNQHVANPSARMAIQSAARLYAIEQADTAREFIEAAWQRAVDGRAAEEPRQVEHTAPRLVPEKSAG